MYMFEALLSRGAVVKDHLLATETTRDDFVEIACRCYKEDKAVIFYAVLFIKIIKF